MSKLNGKDKDKDKDKEKEKEEEKARSEVDTFNDDDLPLPPPYAADKKKYKELIKDHDKESLSEIPSEKRDLDASVLTMDSLRHPFLSPPSPTSPHSPPDEVVDVRRKETMAAVAQMKNKLRNMGVLGVTGEIGRKLEFRDRNRAGPATAAPSSPSKPDVHAVNDSEDYFYNGGEAGSHPAPLPVPLPLRSPASPGAQSKRAKSPSTLSEEIVPPPPPRTSHIKQTKSRSRSGSPKQKIPSPTQNRFLEVDVDDEDYGSVQGTIAFELAPVVGSPSNRKAVIPASAFSNDANDDKEQEQGQGHVLLKPIPHPSNLTNMKSLHHNDDKNGVEVSSPRLPSAPTSPSKERSRGGTVRVMSDDTSIAEQREDPLTDLYKQKEEKLRLKAAQCKQIIR